MNAQVREPFRAILESWASAHPLLNFKAEMEAVLNEVRASLPASALIPLDPETQTTEAAIINCGGLRSSAKSHGEQSQ